MMDNAYIYVTHVEIQILFREMGAAWIELLYRDGCKLGWVEQV